MIAVIAGLMSCGKDKNSTVDVSFVSVTADGGSDTGTTALTLTFDKEVAGLNPGNITIAENTATKGTLTAKGNGVYELGLSNITSQGTITVTVAKEGYIFTPESRTATVYPTHLLTKIEYIGGNTDTRHEYFTELTTEYGYIEFHANDCYTLGTTYSAGSSALVVNCQFEKTLDKYEVALAIWGGEENTTMSLGYVTDPADIDSYVKITDINYSTIEGVHITEYTVSLSGAKNLPATAYLTLHFTSPESWHNNSFTKIIVTPVE